MRTPRWREQTAGAGLPGPWPVGLTDLGLPLTTSDLARARRWLLLGGGLAIIAGSISIAVPLIASVTISILVGWVLVFGAILMTTHAVSDRSPLRILQGLLTLVVGLYIVLAPLSGTVSLTFVLAVWFFASGVMNLLHAWQWRDARGTWITALGGGLSITLGVLIAVGLPSSAAWAIGLLVGIELLFWGMRAVLAAQAMKQLLRG
jgi:uncharacterized membrane protein HdeD (DUF308 family)